MGYRWQTNEHPDLAYDLFIFKPATACIVRVRQTRYRIDPETIYEDLIPDDLREVRCPAVPGMVPKRDLAPHLARAGLATAPGISDRCR